MDANVREWASTDIKTFHNVDEIHPNTNLKWIGKYDGDPLYVVDHIQEVTQVKSILTF